MATIRVPAPPKQSFQKNRPISDLLASQIKHFQHIETKLDLTMPTSSHRIATENDAAQYIAQMTHALLNRTPQTPAAPGPTPPPGTKPRLVPRRAPARAAKPAQGIPIAAAASASKTKKKAVKKKASAKKSSSKKTAVKKAASKKSATTRPKGKQS
jgi:hypothetical protein